MGAEGERQDEGGDDGDRPHCRAWQPMIRRWWRTRVRRRDLEPGPPLTPEVEERIWAEVQRRIALGEAGRPQLAPLPDRRPLILSIALVVCALLTTGLIAAQRPGAQQQEVATADTVESAGPTVTMNDLARVARRQPAVPLDDGLVLSLTVDHLPSATQRAQDLVGWREVRELTNDGRGVIRLSSLPGAPGTYPASEDDFTRPGSLRIAGLGPAEVAALPSDPATLLAALQEAVSTRSSVASAVFFDLLATPLLTGGTRAAVFHLLDDMGAEVGETSTDPLHRSGVTVVVPPRDGNPGLRAVVDPATSALLSLRLGVPETTLDPAILVYQPGTVGPAG